MSELSRGDRIRASDAERAQVAKSLATAFEEGRLDLGEYDRRTAAAYAAVTRGELAFLLDDLPPEPVAERYVARPVGPRPERRADRASWVGFALVLTAFALCLARVGMLAPAVFVGVIVLTILVTSSSSGPTDDRPWRRRGGGTRRR